MADWLNNRDVEGKRQELDEQVVNKRRAVKNAHENARNFFDAYDISIQNVLRDVGETLVKPTFFAFVIPQGKPYKVVGKFRIQNQLPGAYWQLGHRHGWNYNTHELSQNLLMVIGTQFDQQGYPKNVSFRFADRGVCADGTFDNSDGYGVNNTLTVPITGRIESDIQSVKDAIKTIVVVNVIRAVYPKMMPFMTIKVKHWVVEYGSELEPGFLSLGRI